MSDETQEPKPPLTADDQRVLAVVEAAHQVCDRCENFLAHVRNFKTETGKSIATPAEIFYVGGVSRMIEAFTRDIQGRLDAIQK